MQSSVITELDALRACPTSIIGDELGRASLLSSALVLRSAVASFVGPVRTASCVAGDISAVLHLLDLAQPGDVLMIDGRGYTETAIWGEIMQNTAEAIGIAGVVIDGAVRDTDYLIKSDIPVFSRAVSPRGPQLSAVGSVGQPISCAGLAVHPGDVAVGDDDGIVIIRPDAINGLAERCQQRIASERDYIARIRQGERPRSLFGLTALPQA